MTDKFRIPGPALAIALLALLIGLSFQGTRPLFEPDEGRYTDIALQMLASGDYLTPRINPEHAHYAKPPLTYWLLAGSLRALGQNEWAARLPNALAFALTALCVLRLGRRVVPRAPWWPALIWTTLLAPVVCANLITPDTVLTLWIALAILLCLSALTSGDARARGRFFLLMWIVWGLAFLTKGPPALLPLAAVVLVLSLRGDRRRLRELASPAGVVVFLLVAFSWFVLMTAREPQLLRFFLHDEIYTRLFTTQHARNSNWYGAIEVYAPTLLVGALPWWPLALGRLNRLRVLGTRAFWRSPQYTPVLPVLVTWIVLSLLVFCVARSRLATYPLPLFVPIALLLGRVTADRLVPLLIPPIGTAGRQRPAVVPAAAFCIWVVLLLLLKAYGDRLTPERDSRALAAQLLQVAPVEHAQRIIFVESEPALGLSFYLDRVVEAARLRPDSRLPYTDESDVICARLGANAASVLLVPPAERAKLAQALQRCGNRTLQLAGRAGHYDVFAPGVGLRLAVGGPPGPEAQDRRGAGAKK